MSEADLWRTYRELFPFWRLQTYNCSPFTIWISLQHMMVMEDMLKDFLLGEHLLLVGNQVSKNNGKKSETFNCLLKLFCPHWRSLLRMSHKSFYLQRPNHDQWRDPALWNEQSLDSCLQRTIFLLFSGSQNRRWHMFALLEPELLNKHTAPWWASLRTVLMIYDAHSEASFPLTYV